MTFAPATGSVIVTLTAPGCGVGVRVGVGTDVGVLVGVTDDVGVAVGFGLGAASAETAVPATKTATTSRQKWIVEHRMFGHLVSDRAESKARSG